MKPKVVSLFAGMGGFDLAFEREGFDVVAQVEIDKNCQKLLKSKWPSLPLISNIHDAGAFNLPRCDVITAGWPCQDLSLAGQRKGLNGERSGLFYELARIVAELRPSFLVLENVPGMLSSKGATQIILDTLTKLGYAVDIDIKDAQEFGIAQRRRRVFLVCAKLSDLLKRKTTLSRQIAGDLLVQHLHDVLIVSRQAWSAGSTLLDSELQIAQRAASLRMRTMLFDGQQEERASSNWLSTWADLLHLFMDERELSAFIFNELKLKHLLNPECVQMVTSVFELEAVSDQLDGCSVTYKLLKSLSEGAYFQKNKCITSTSFREMIPWIICFFARTFTFIAERMLRSIDSSKDCWSVEQSVLIAVKDVTNYARSASECLFVNRKLRDYWRTCFSSASSLQKLIEKRIGKRRAEEILSIREGVRRDFETCEKAAQRIAPTLEGRAGRSGANNFATSGGLTEVAKPCAGHHFRQDLDCDTLIAHCLNGKAGYRSDGESETFIAHTLNAGRDGYNDGSDQTYIPVAYRTAGNCGPFEQGDKTAALNTATDPNQNIIAFNSRGRESGSNVELADKASIRSSGGGSSRSYVQTYGVRRLTPLECLRLQGFPDDYFDGLNFSDSAKYKMLGNAVAVPVARWIAKRMRPLFK